jgi:hypothetical protein
MRDRKARREAAARGSSYKIQQELDAKSISKACAELGGGGG